jgi:hypothetical protein
MFCFLLCHLRGEAQPGDESSVRLIELKNKGNINSVADAPADPFIWLVILQLMTQRGYESRASERVVTRRRMGERGKER